MSRFKGPKETLEGRTRRGDTFCLRPGDIKDERDREQWKNDMEAAAMTALLVFFCF